MMAPLIIGFLVLILGIFIVVRKRSSRKKDIASQLNISPQVFKNPTTQNTDSPQPSTSPTNTSTRGPWWQALTKTRAKFFFNQQFQGEIYQLKEAIEEACLVSDLGVGNTQELIEKMNWPKITELAPEKRLEIAKQELALHIKPWLQVSNNQTQQASSTSDNLSWLTKHKTSLGDNKSGPIVVWFVGVNGVGKTTSISKLATELKNKGHSVLLGAGDTFRAAASEQLETWADRIGIPIVKGQAGSDSSAVLFDAIQAAKARGIDFVLCDSAGRLHNQTQLMDSLKKVSKILDKAQKGAPHEVLLVLDANTGQNMIHQAEHFLGAVGVTGLILTKLDGTAKGGAVVAVARKTNLPIRRLGLGEKVDDFIAFDAHKFSEALVGISQ
jgi:signal recognition particle-docking protein FtsY